MTVGSCTPVPEEYLPVEAKGEPREMGAVAVRGRPQSGRRLTLRCTWIGAEAGWLARFVHSHQPCCCIPFLFTAGLVFDLDGERQLLAQPDRGLFSPCLPLLPGVTQTPGSTSAGAAPRAELPT